MGAEMRLLRGLRGALAAASVCGLVVVSSAGATTVTVGQHFTPTDTCGSNTYLQTGVASGTSYAVPKGGVITSWSVEEAASTVPGLKLKVGRSAGVGTYTIVADAAAGAQTPNSVNTYKAHIPVKGGDLIGMSHTGGFAECGDVTSNSMDTYVWRAATCRRGRPSRSVPPPVPSSISQSRSRWIAWSRNSKARR